MIGFPFFECNSFLLELYFNACNLNLASFFNLKLKKTRFDNCNLQGVDFTETDLEYAIFNTSDLTSAIFENTNLENTDFRTASNYTINPEKNKLKDAKFLKEKLYGLLSIYNISVE